MWNKEELPGKWKESIIVQIYKMDAEADCSNYCGKSLLSTSYKVLSKILSSRLSPYTCEIIGDHQCELQCNSSTTDQISCIRQILEKELECNETVHQQFIDLKRAYESLRREVLYSMLIEFGVSMKLVWPINICLIETNSELRIGRYLSDMSSFRIHSKM
jgi:hypothetical protein